MATQDLSAPARSTRASVFVGDLTVGTLIAAAAAVCVAQMALAIPAALNGLFPVDPGPGRIRGAAAEA